MVNLDWILCRYDSAFCRPPGAPLRSFLTECLAGPLVGGDPKLIHRFCDLYEHARHSYRWGLSFWSICGLMMFNQIFRAFGEVELQNFNNLLVELRSLVATNRCAFSNPILINLQLDYDMYKHIWNEYSITEQQRGQAWPCEESSDAPAQESSQQTKKKAFAGEINGSKQWKQWWKQWKALNWPRRRLVQVKNKCR